MNRLAYHDAIGRNRRGEVSSPDGLGNPTPTNSRAASWFLIRALALNQS